MSSPIPPPPAAAGVASESEFVKGTSQARFWMVTWFFPAQFVVEKNALNVKMKEWSSMYLTDGANWPDFPVGNKDDEIASLVYQLEVCPQTQRHHVQAYVEFRKPIRFKAALEKLGMPGAHVAKRFKSREACFNYCTKEETRLPDTFPVILGELAEVEGFKNRQGQRSDIAAIVDIIKNGGTQRDQLESNPDAFVRSHRGFAKVEEIYKREKANQMRELRTEVHWGKPGSGKTRLVYERHGLENVFTLIADNNATWFDGYEGQDVLLIDDFNGWMVWSMLLKVLDRYPLRLPVKGGFTYANWTKVYITSNVKPDNWYPLDSDPLAVVKRDPGALRRRLHGIYEYTDIHLAFMKKHNAVMGTIIGASASCVDTIASGKTIELDDDESCTLVASVVDTPVQTFVGSAIYAEGEGELFAGASHSPVFATPIALAHSRTFNAPPALKRARTETTLGTGTDCEDESDSEEDS